MVYIPRDLRQATHSGSLQLPDFQAKSEVIELTIGCRMKNVFFLFSFLMISCVSISKPSPDPVRTVDFVDLSRYLGDWYEIASFPQWFQKDCYCTRAQYSLREDGKVDVLNTCNKGTVNGEFKSAHGYAKVVDEKSNAKLKVTFFWPFFGDYWIIGLDKDYRYAVISNSDRSTLWILSRTPELRADLYEEALHIAKAQGLDLTKLKLNEIKGCVYP
jgi:apolipoprotein D and lipocalin family protein